MIEDTDELVRLAECYNRPPAPPRELMWSRIAAQRSVRRRRHRRLALPAAWLGMAATLVLGIGLGRMSVRPPASGAPEESAVLPLPPVAAPARREITPPLHAPAVSHASARPAAGVAPPEAGGPATDAHRERSVRQTVVSEPDAGRRFALATHDYIQETEALLARLGTGDHPPGLEHEFVGQARDLLLTTRVLLDSPFGGDPQVAGVLQDLELVLTQASQLHAADRTNLHLVAQAIGRHDLLERIRAAKLNPVLTAEL